MLLNVASYLVMNRSFRCQRSQFCTLSVDAFCNMLFLTDEPDTDLETDRLLGQQRTDDQGFFDDKVVSIRHVFLSVVGKVCVKCLVITLSKDVTLHHPYSVDFPLTGISGQSSNRVVNQRAVKSEETLNTEA